MNRLLAFLLIPLLACGYVFAHPQRADHGASGHADLPHIHIDSNAHSHPIHGHGHIHSDELPAHGDRSLGGNERQADHDNDAIYLAVGHPFLAFSASWSLPSHLDCVGLTTDFPGRVTASLAGRYALSSISNRTGPVLYLLHAALRL